MNLGQIRGVNSLRTVGVVLVILYHYLPNIMPAGFLGVDLFFAITGFLITALFVKEYERKRSIDLIGFFARRVRRLLPAAAFMVAVTLALALLVSPDLRVGIGNQAAAVFGWVTNYYEIAVGASYEQQFLPHLFVHTWALGVEMQYYLGWGLLVFLAFFIGTKRGADEARIRRILLIGCGILAVLAYIHMQTLVGGGGDPSPAYYATTSRGYSLLAGSALGLLTGMRTPKKELAPVIAVPAIAVSVVLIIVLSRALSFSALTTYHWGLLAAAGLTTLILYAILCLQRFVWFREIRLVALVGRRSYSLYLFHWPVFILMKQWGETGAGPFPARTPLAVIVVLSLIVSIALAEVSFRFFEQRPIAAPERRAVSRGPRRGARVLTAACAIAIGFSCLAVASAPPKTQIQADYEQQQQLLNTQQMSAYNAYLQALALNPVGLHGQADKLPESPSERAAREAADPLGLLAPAAAAPTGGDGTEIVPVAPPGSDVKVTVFGDSVTLGAAEALQATLGPDAIIDAKESRNMGAAPDMIDQYNQKGQLGEYVVLALFTNYQEWTVGATYVAIDKIPPGHKIILVTPYGKDYMEAGAQFCRDLAKQFDYVTVADWNTLIKQHTDELAPDGIHMDTQNSRQLYANCVAQAIKAAEKGPAKPEKQ
ncbi:MAG: acyltransferase [Clostridiales bacterium]|nr:acyltransferase [Clostridiales bacterium]